MNARPFLSFLNAMYVNTVRRSTLSPVLLDTALHAVLTDTMIALLARLVYPVILLLALLVHRLVS
jgi:hypothetical protein